MVTIYSRFRNRLLFIFYVIVFRFLFLSPVSGQAVLEDSLLNGNNYEKASYSFWFNSDIKKIRGIIVLMPGSNYDGRNMVYDTAWQNLAVRHDFALQKLTSEGYIGIISTRQILPDSLNKQVEITSWFPNSQIAEGWLDFIK